jgi:hypothetical protein
MLMVLQATPARLYVVGKDTLLSNTITVAVDRQAEEGGADRAAVDIRMR